MSDRPIEELLKLDTYQDMTDSEIDTLIKFIHQRAYQDGYAAANSDRNVENDEALIKTSADLTAYSKQLLDTLCNQPVFLEVVDNG